MKLNLKKFNKKSVDNGFLFIRVGTKNHPASKEDISNVESVVTSLGLSNVLIAHHAMKIEEITYPSKESGVLLVKVGSK